ncbi:MAG: DNA repair protein RadA [Cyanobacteria bacterium P01_H01_bin.74]
MKSKSKPAKNYSCRQCDYQSSTYLGRCPQCNGWSTLQPVVAVSDTLTQPKTDTLRTRLLTTESLENAFDTETGTRLNQQILKLGDVKSNQQAKFSSGFAEFDRVLGGGILPGSYTLIGGDPGIGKSTLMLQVAGKLCESGKSVLYIAGEESPYQIKCRAERLAASAQAVEILAETNVEKILLAIQSLKALPDLMIVDSIQSLYCPDASGTPGSVGQIKECAALLMGIAKKMGLSIVLIGHVTKEGAVSGPKLLEHTVDAVLYFEGDQYQNLRIIRSVKNRFGSTNEIGVYEMLADGLHEVANPSELFLGQTGFKETTPGSVLTAVMQGSRPVLVELQALVGQSAYASPRRVGIGIEQNRLHQIIAVLERRIGLDFSKQDVYVNVVGGLKVTEPAIDLAIAMAITGSTRNISVLPGMVISGEIGLTGEIRVVRHLEQRIAEAQRIGLCKFVMPKIQLSSKSSGKGLLKQASQSTQSKRSGTSDAVDSEIDKLSVQSLADAIQACFVHQ